MLLIESAIGNTLIISAVWRTAAVRLMLSCTRDLFNMYVADMDEVKSGDVFSSS